MTMLHTLVIWRKGLDGWTVLFHEEATVEKVGCNDVCRLDKRV